MFSPLLYLLAGKYLKEATDLQKRDLLSKASKISVTEDHWAAWFWAWCGFGLFGFGRRVLYNLLPASFRGVREGEFGKRGLK